MKKHSFKCFLTSHLQRKIDKPSPIIDLEPDVVKLMLDNYHDGIPPERGLFITRQGEPPKFVAIDNSTGDMWTEEFDSRSEAERWLRRLA